jgi:hypothetical protein
MSLSTARLTTDNILLNLQEFDFSLYHDPTNPYEAVLYMNLVGVLGLLERFATPDISHLSLLKDVENLQRLYVLNSEQFSASASKFNIKTVDFYSTQLNGICNTLFDYVPFNQAAQKVLLALKSGKLLLQFTDYVGDDINHGVINRDTDLILVWQFPTDFFKYVQEGRIAVFHKMILHIWMLAEVVELNFLGLQNYNGPNRQTFITARKLSGQFSRMMYKEGFPEWMIQDIVLFLLSQLEEKSKAWYVANFHLIDYTILPQGEYVDDLQILNFIITLKSKSETKIALSKTITQFLQHKKYQTSIEKDFLRFTTNLLQVATNH